MTVHVVIGISKNECFCTPRRTGGKSGIITADERTKKDATQIQVDDWRTQKFQSPIEFRHDDTIYHYHFDPLEFHGHWDIGGKAVIRNDGHTVKLTFQDRVLPFLKGGPLTDEYTFEQLHFHWSEDDFKGCEHIFEGKPCSMEVHVVHYNKKYGNFKEASTKPDGLCVVAFFLLATDDTENADFIKLSAGLPNITEHNASTCVQSDCLSWIKEQAQCKGYYTYQGSLTTEPYNESVTWILYPNPIHISRDQVCYFRKIKGVHSTEGIEIKQNIRPVQTPPENRKLNILYVESHKEDECNDQK